MNSAVEKSRIWAQKQEYQLNTENSNWQGALKFSPHLSGKSVGSSEKAKESKLLDSRAELVWEPADLHSGLTVSSKLLLPLNPFLPHNETDGTCAELRGVCKTHPALQSEHESCRCTVRRYEGFSVQRWNEMKWTTSLSAPRSFPRGHLHQLCCWLANRGGKWVKELVDDQQEINNSQNALIAEIYLIIIPPLYTAKVERSLFASKKCWKMWRLVILRRARASFQNKVSVWKTVSTWIK